MSQQQTEDSLPEDPDKLTPKDLPGAHDKDMPEDHISHDTKIELAKDQENLDGAAAMMRDPIVKTSAYRMKRFISVEEALASDPNLVKLEERRAYHMMQADKWKKQAIQYERRIPSLKRMLVMFRTAYALHNRASRSAFAASELTYWIKRRIQDHNEQVTNHNKRIEHYQRVRSTPLR